MTKLDQFPIETSNRLTRSVLPLTLSFIQAVRCAAIISKGVVLLLGLLGLFPRSLFSLFNLFVATILLSPAPATRCR